MKRFAIASLALMTFWIAGCGAPRWVERGPDAWTSRKQGEIAFIGYSHTRELPGEAEELALRNSAEKVAEWLMEGVKVSEAFDDDLRQESGFDRMPNLFIATLTDIIERELATNKFQRGRYMRRRKDNLETRYEVWLLQGIHRADLANILSGTTAKNAMSLAIDESRIASSESARRRMVVGAHMLLDSIAGDIRGLYQPAR